MHTELNILRWNGTEGAEALDSVAQEEPLEILMNGKSLAVTMRTPGDDFALATGFLYTESLVQTAQDIEAIGYIGRPCDPDWHNLVNVTLRAGKAPPRDAARLQRNFLSTSSCGVCGKASLEAAKCLAAPLPNTEFVVPIGIFQTLNATLRAAQSTFDKTGGLHAAGLFDGEGNLLALREDVGRHNAVDKLIGAELIAGHLPLSAHILMVSGRTSFELLQKAAMARIPILCAVSAPSSLAVKMASDLNITLIGFLRGASMNIYTGAHRLAIPHLSTDVNGPVINANPGIR